jgi:hypothetical protein
MRRFAKPKLLIVVNTSFISKTAVICWFAMGYVASPSRAHSFSVVKKWFNTGVFKEKWFNMWLNISDGQFQQRSDDPR